METDLLRSTVKYTHKEKTADQALMRACVRVYACVHVFRCALYELVRLLMYFYATDLRVGIYVLHIFP